MTIVSQSSERSEAPLFSDGIGDRAVAADGATGDQLQILRIRPALTAVPSFEFALRERAARLANFRHAYYARVRRIDRIQMPAPGLAIVSDHVEGTRLSDILRVAHERHLQLDINTALCLIRQLVPAVALLHENAREVAHGLIAPERLIVTPHTRLVIVEHVLAGAIEQLQFGRERLWQDFRIAMPPSAGVPRFDHRADVLGMGLVSLSLVLGRPLRADEFPQKLPALLNEARERTALGEEQPLSGPLREWLARVLQLDLRRAFASAPEALTAFEEVVADDSMYVPAPIALETFLTRYIDALLESTPQEVRTVPGAAPAQPAATARPGVSAAAPGVSHLSPIDAAAATISPSPRVVPQESAHGSHAPVSTAAAGGAPTTSARAAQTIPTSPERAARPAVPARDITDLLSSSDLPPSPTGVRGAPKPLFDPADPFSVPNPVSVASPMKRRVRPAWVQQAAILGAILLLGGGAVFASKMFRSGAPQPAAPSMGTLSVQSNPAGAQVFVDGVDRGLTPARVSVTPGSHILELRGRGTPRVIPLSVAAGAEVSQYLEFAQMPVTGLLQVQSQPPGAKVLVDGTDRGVAPLTVADLTPGEHEVVLQTPAASVRHVVNVQAGATASLVAPIAAEATAGPVSGWLAVKAPFSIEIHEQGRLLGTSDTDRVMMAAGRHELELVNETLGYHTTRVVQVPAGKVASINIDLPNGVVNLNASPWAEVWIDGQRVGETPIGNLSVPIGPHEVVFRNPQLGEKRHAISVTLGTPVRLSVDMK